MTLQSPHRRTALCGLATAVGLCTGAVYGLFRFVYAAPPPEFTVLGLNAALHAND